MPATEQIWRSTSRLHKIFAVSGVILLASTIWMLAKDHARPWKPYQRTANQVELTLTDWRKIQYETNDALAEHAALVEQLDAARSQAIDWSIANEFVKQVEASPVTAGSVEAAKAVEVRVKELTDLEGTAKAEAARESIINQTRDIVAALRVTEETRLGELKFARANRDAVIATLGLQVRDNKPSEEMDAQQVKVDAALAKVDVLQREYDEAKTQRLELQAIIKKVTAAEDAAQEALAKNQAGLMQLNTAETEKRSTYITWYKDLIPLPGKRWLELPILDAFNSPRKIDNLWSDGLLIDYNFSKVRRFDRCTTCHQSIQKTNPGSAVDPAYVNENLIDFVLLPPDSIETSENAGEQTPDALLAQYYGLRLAPEGLLAVDDVTVQFVRPESLASQAAAIVENEVASASGADIRSQLLSGGNGNDVPSAGLKLADVIAAIDGDPIRDASKAIFRLLDAAESGETLALTIRRGLPSPYTSHPRLDLFVGSLSPHKMADFACTICHEGQGSATAFEWASHTPNTKLQSEKWSRELGWSDNPHWIYPMYPNRFAEASCLKCHHDVTELEPSERFPDVPAPKVVHGYNLVRKFGCYGCHEISGFDRGRRVGPDLRLEPNFFAAALQLQTEPGFQSFSQDVKNWTAELAEHPERDAVRHRIYEALQADALAESPALSNRTHATLVPLFKDVENAGELRKAGPSLRYAKQKLDSEFMFDWILAPKNFRPTSRMPQFFGLWSHFTEGPDAKATDFEPLEILGIVSYLNGRSQDFAYLESPEGVAEASAERGKVLFEERGCLACHNHNAFPDTATFRDKDEIIQGPDLSGIGAKFSAERNPGGAKWLYSWIKQPSRYHARTVMPDLFLTPISQPDGTKTDPAADIVAYLLENSKVDWHPAEGILASSADANLETLDRLVLENLNDAFAEAAAIRYAKQGIPSKLRDELKGAEIELLTDPTGADAAAELTTEAKLLYLGSKSISKYGCYACHDVPGFEDAKPIGTVLADWGRKESSKLAFEHISHYLEGHGHAGHNEAAAHEGGAHAEELPAADDGETEEMRDFYHGQIESHHREGFLYQKLAEPRSYDYHKTENKKYNERLRMPKFPLTADEREAVITFIIGLVADPPTAKYVYTPDPRQTAIIEGRQVLDKFNCAGCHMLEPEQWNIAHTADAFGEQPASKAYPFLKTHFTSDELADAAKKDTSGLLHSILKGMPALEDLPDGVRPLIYDDFGDPVVDDDSYSPMKLEFPFDLWQPTTIGGNGFEVGVLPLNVRTPQIEKKYSTRGGFLAKYLLQPVTQREKQVNPAAKGTEAWGWLPPPLVREGVKVQSSWLHDFLLNPYPIRPAVLLQMPRFNMSPEEATKLVNYFAAIDNADYPYDTNERQQDNHIGALEAAYQQTVGGAGTRFGDAMKIVTNNNYCVKCHLVGDFEPKGANRAKAPNLAVVYNRLRPDYLRDWIANPKTLLPYTSMPVNVPYDPDAPNLGGVSQDLYHGTSVEQVEALVDLLLNYDKYMTSRSSVTELITGEAPAETAASVVPSPVAQPTVPVPAPMPMPKPAEPSPEPKPAPVAAAKTLPEFLKNLPKASGWGDLKVRFAFDGTAPSPAPLVVTKDQEFCGKFGLVDESLVVNPENHGIKNVVASLYRGTDKSPIPIHESYLSHALDDILLDNDKCRFEPRVSLLWTTQTLVIKNSDTVGHNTKIEVLSNTAINDIVPAGAMLSRQFPQAERTPAAPVACSIHPWMNAWLVVRDNPYFAVSNKDGELEIENLPAGDWTIQFWHEKPGYVSEVNVAGKKTEWKRGRLDVKIENGKVMDLGEVQFAP